MVQDKVKYEEECLRLLNDTQTYSKLRGDPTRGIKKKLECLVDKYYKLGLITDKEKSFLLIEKPSIPVLYTLPKIHKDLQQPPGRPIVAGVNSVTSNLSQMIDYHLQPFMAQIDSYLKDTGHILRKLEEVTWAEGSFLITADVSSLYTIIEHSKGLEAIQWMLDKSSLSTERKGFILEGIEFILKKKKIWL